MTDGPAPDDDAARFAPLGDDPFRVALAGALASAYDLGRELEGGGMSRVFVAEERSLGRTVVVKVLPPDLAAGVNRDRFRREIKLAAQLQHPHIVPLLSAGEVELTGAESSLYYTMPFIEGESLRAAVLRGVRFSPRDVARILHDVVEGLAYAHARGVIHRDIKPGNVLMLGNHALVTDFGVAKALSAAQGRSGTTTIGLAIGTPAYMAPEQLAADPAADHRMDLYAAGLVAYELLRGESPFAAASPQATMAAQLTRIPEPLHECCHDVPAELSAVIMRCLEKSPDDRWPSADAMLAALDGALTPVTGPPGARPGRTAPRDDAGGAQPYRRALFVVAAGVLVAAGGAALVATRDEAPPPAQVVARDDAALRVPVAEPAAPALAPAEPAPAATPRQTRAAAPRELTRADSLAIAEAVQQRLAETQRARGSDVPSIRELDRLRTVIHRDISDSLRRAMAGATAAIGQSVVIGERFAGAAVGMGAGARSGAVVARIASRTAPPREGMRRVAVLTFSDATTRADLVGIAPALEAALRRAVGEQDGYELADTIATREALRSLRSPELVTAATHAGAAIHGTVFVQRDTLVLMAQVFDARRGYPRVVTAKRALSGGGDPGTAVPVFTERVLAEMRRVSWTGPARRDARGGPRVPDMPKMPRALLVPGPPPASPPRP